ncbi:pyridoxal phosphate-dependent aminotransferase [Streptomyces sp. NPDC031705]|uniref:pyridoxal phosphate-dependent aminotransferase n=1 Tax=unclassified Streptomyces TaxID=2593676 RepID=UPI0033E65CF6
MTTTRFSARWAESAARGTGLIAMSAADMDLSLDPLIAEAIAERLTEPVGYPPPYTTSGVAATLADYYRRAHGLEVPAEAFWLSTGTVSHSAALFAHLLEPGDEVLYFAPSYHGITRAIEDAGCVPVGVPHDHEAGRWTPESLADAVTGRTEAIYLCNPHNPTGHAFTRSELEWIADLAERENLRIFSNELHSRTMLDRPHLPISSLSESTAERTVTFSGATKSHNMAGIGGSFAFSHDTDLINRARRDLAMRMPTARALQQAALRAAYQEDSPWLVRTRRTIRQARDRICEVLSSEAPQLKFHQPAATYFLWLRWDNLRHGSDACEELFRRCGIVGLPGTFFGAEKSFVRLAFATDAKTIENVVGRLHLGLSLRKELL